MTDGDLDIDGITILSALPVPTLLINDDNLIIFANERCEVFFARSKNRLLGYNIADIVKFNNDRINKAIIDQDNDLSAQNMEVITPSGPTVVDVLMSALNPPHKLRLLIMKHREVRDYIGDHSEAGDQMALGAPAILSHEIKNPLAGIKGAAQFLSKNVEGTALSMTKLIVAEVDRIARLLDQMQNLGHQIPATFSVENIHIILDQAVQSIKIANPNFTNIECHYDPSLPNIYVDYDAVLQVLINLIQNAIDACSVAKEPHIIITTRFVMSGSLRRDNDDKSTIKLPIEVTIKDNGPGIPEHIKNELFTPFVTTKREGQGLGLAIVRKFVRLLNSRILHDRDDKNGITIFRLLLPMANDPKK